MRVCIRPDSKVHGVNMGPTWVLSAPDGSPCWPHEPCYQGRSCSVGCCFVSFILQKVPFTKR